MHTKSIHDNILREEYDVRNLSHIAIQLSSARLFSEKVAHSVIPLIRTPPFSESQSDE